jgi:hypothetical protein
MKRETRITLGLLVLILVTAQGYSAGILAFDDVSAIYDPLELSRTSLLFGRGLSRLDGSLTDAFFTHSGASAFPPLIHYTALPVTLAFNDGMGAPVVSFALFIIIIVLSTYAIGMRVGGQSTGLLAAALVMTAPGLSGFSRVYMVDFPLAAITTACVAMLFMTDNFCHKRFTFTFGALLGLGLLTKQSFPIYIAWPFAAIAIPALSKADSGVERKTRVMCLGSAIVFGILIGLTWLWPRMQTFFIDRQIITDFYRQIEPRTFNTMDYVGMLASFAAGPPLFAAAVVGIFASPRNRKSYALIAWLLVPLILCPMVFSMLTPRYILPVVPACAVLAALSVRRLAGKQYIAAAFTLLALSVGFLQWHAWRQPAGNLDIEMLHARFQEIGVARPQSVADNPARIVEAIWDKHEGGRVVMLMDSPFTEGVQGGLWERNLLFPVDNLFEMAGIGKLPVGLVEPDEILSYLRDSEMILVARGRPDDPSTYAPGGGVPDHYATKVFDAFYQIRHAFGLLTQQETEGGLTLQLLVKLEK